MKLRRWLADIAEIRDSLTLDSDTVINVYFTPADGYTGSFTASVDNGTGQAYAQGADKRYCVQISGIAAHELSREYTIKVTTDNGSVTVTVSALSYVNSVLKYYDDENDADHKAPRAAAGKGADSFIVMRPEQKTPSPAPTYAGGGGSGGAL